MYNIEDKTTFIGNSMCLAVIISNLSQMSVFVESGKTQLLSLPAWGGVIAVCLFMNLRPKVSKIRGVVFGFICFIIYAFIIGVINEEYSHSQLTKVIPLSFGMLIIGSSIGKNITYNDLERIYASYIISSFLVGLDVFNIYFLGQDWNSRSYLYDEKNSFSQIMLTSWIFILFAKIQTSKFLSRIIYLLIFLFITLEIVIMKSRATIICMPLVIGIAAANGKVSPRFKQFSILILIIFAFLMIDRDFSDFIINSILYGGRDSTDINDISSGRSDEWVAFFDDWTNPVLGVGRCKRESIILTALLEFGIIGGIPILLLAFYPVTFLLKNYRRYKSNIHFLIFTALAISYVLNGIFEQLAPFGPGVKCYFLWIMLGVLASKNKVLMTKHI